MSKEEEKRGGGRAVVRGDATDAELAVLEVLWRGGGRTIGEITAELYPTRRTAEYATVQSLLQRLEAKGLVGRDRSERAHRFSARAGRDELIGRRLEVLAEKLCGGSLTPLLTHLVRARKLDEGEQRELRELLMEWGGSGDGAGDGREGGRGR